MKAAGRAIMRGNKRGESKQGEGGEKRRVNERHKERINNREVICRRQFFVLICAAEDQL